MELIAATEAPAIKLKTGPCPSTEAGPLRARFCLALILLLAVVVRLHFFVGFVGADPQDDNLYVMTIKSMVDGTYSLAPTRTLLTRKNFNPAYYFQLRMSFLVPERILVKYFGPSDFSFTLFPFLCSLGEVLLAYFFMSRLAGNRTLGLLSAFLLSVYPVDCIYATKISVDVPLGFLIALTIFFFLRGEARNGDNDSSKTAVVSYLLCGLFFSAANGIKSLGIILPIFFLLYFLSFRRLRWRHLFIVIGFLPLAAALSYYFYANSGDPFLMNTSMRGMQLFNYLDESKSGAFNAGFMKVLYTYGEPFSHTQWAFAFKPYLSDMVRYLTIYYYLFVGGGAIWYFSFRKTYPPERNKIIVSLLIWVVGGFLFMELFPASFRDIFINHKYYMLPKQPRFHVYMGVPVACIGAFLFYSLRNRRTIMYIGLLIVAATSFYSMSSIKAHYTDGVKDMAEAAKYIEAHPEQTYYTDTLASIQLRYRLRYNPNIRIENINSLRSEGETGGGVLIIGGARSVDIDGEYVLSNIPEWARQAFLNENETRFVCINRFNYPLSDRRSYRKYNLKMLMLRPGAASG